jgi:hypothetical protein
MTIFTHCPGFRRPCGIKLEVEVRDWAEADAIRRLGSWCPSCAEACERARVVADR